MSVNLLRTKGGVSLTNEGLQQLVSLMKDWIPDDASIAVASANAYSKHISGAHDIRIQKEQTIEKGSIAEAVIKKKCKVEKLVDDSIFGVSYYGIGYPIQIEEKEGALIIILPTTQSTFKTATAHLFNREK